MDRGRIGAAIVALVLATLGAVPAARAGPWVASYRIALLGGFQSTTWTLEHTPISACDAPAVGSGVDQTTFYTSKPVTAQVIGGVGGPSRVPRVTLGIAYAESRQGTITPGAAADANPGDCPTPSAAAAGSPQAPAGAPDCRTTRERTRIDVELNPAAPVLVQHYTGVHFDSPYVNCPVAGVVPPQFAGPLTLALPVLGVAGAPDATATLTAQQPIDAPGYSGSTQLELRLALRRLVAVEAMRIPAGGGGPITVPVGRHGQLTLPLRCPMGSACRGSVALSVGNANPTAAYPLAPAGGGHPIAVAGFLLGAGRRGVRMSLAGGRAAARRLAATRVDVVVTEVRGGRSVTYDVGTVRL